MTKNVFRRKINEEEEITIERLENCLVILAKVITFHGEKYLPLFERFQREIEERKRKDDIMTLVNKIANDNQK